ncbi:hypothetical protein CDL15_Pgr011586 [Punica granatum]|uniref:Uncharacterized protein n=1 Tax=Punica granatum TaxID=22663 RepID=A0A218Y1S1_PUNGR|nr:hypothetical protein CDL15_Pgr011586 [Punica granatum]PKI59313.1 hypothetical protein CRG98_020305 [Punica granatum]
MKMGGGEDPGRRRRRFPLLGVAATAREDARDGSKHRLGYAVLGMGVTGVDTAGIEGKSRVFRRGFPKSPISKSSETRVNPPFLLAG